MDKVRIGVIGIGGMGSSHAKRIAEGQIPRCELAAVCDLDPSRFSAFPGVKAYEDSAELIRSGDVDAVIVATPHYGHTTIGIDALEQGLHVLVEKPISVHKADAERLIAAHTDEKQVFAAMFNQRTDPHYRKLKALIESGDLGKIQRTNWIITTWFRTESYYRSGGWRATWEGEGGGVLLNQCPHNLDLFQWLCGMPTSVRALGAIGKYHDIEVEDDITALLEYENGATGVFVTTTGEAPGTNRLEIIGDQGRVVCEGGKLSFTRNETPTSEYCANSPERFGKPEVWNCDIPVKGNGEQHLGILKNYVAAILDGVPLVAPAAEGIRSVELANAMLYAAMTGTTVQLPMDSAVFEKHLKTLIAESTFVKKTDDATDTSLKNSF
ncbi:MAG: Gfo/Idh/MocA family oxidoreductase [Lentisphaerae bacterium]|nr:Gfo/Idh/MocA family oxidoreductase [Lentisphaerota bacterium]MBT4820070.1 Gfo/Idh/MocA family oxidoreductase [Lentisphaerota bacterium]MBT5604760.1 Gfo/Idh/MocA family oxidoreductase [Lentisphaerota bacterium]MBT7053633.1 Gfo/Idh/MocA family oxidoreductase [Lentisphaerota bacterium]MBT7842814.1 Gfo/Idh/MocA family oxidoreductase [Lentisphaerota bacterium]